jgi:hypothetical protein
MRSVQHPTLLSATLGGGASFAVAAFSLLIVGCAPQVASYTPDVIDVTDQAVLTADETFCRTHALAHKEPFSVLALAGSGAQGVLGNATAAAAVPPSAPLILGAGAAGSAGQEALQQLGLNGPTQIKVFVLCLRERSHENHAYKVTDPSQ